MFVLRPNLIERKNIKEWNLFKVQTYVVVMIITLVQVLFFVIKQNNFLLCNLVAYYDLLLIH